jgi:cytosine/adenosine deaminase-related metal-dependent hydrolase
MENFEATGKHAVYYAMDQMHNLHHTLFIHNTQMKEAQIRDAMLWNPGSYFVTCPNANLFIENALPDYRAFLQARASLCIGTDSLSSNWNLSILDEMKVILKYNSWLDTEEVITWACWNGARALRIQNKYGSFDNNTSPGVNWIQSVEINQNNCRFKSDAKVHRII